MWRRLKLAMLWGACCVVAVSQALAADWDDARLQELRRLRRFDEAEQYCADWLRQARPSDPLRLDITLELARTIADRAASHLAGFEERADLLCEMAQFVVNRRS